MILKGIILLACSAMVAASEFCIMHDSWCTALLALRTDIRVLASASANRDHCCKAFGIPYMIQNVIFVM